MIEQYVNKDLLKKAGFYPVPTGVLGQSNSEMEASWYLGEIRDKSIVILSEHKKKENQIFWYLNIFENVPSIRDCLNFNMGQFFVRIRETYTEDHKIAPEALEKAIEDSLAA